MRDLDEVLECHHITGEFSLLVKVRVEDMQAFRRLLIEKLNTVRGVRQTRTLIVLATSKEQHRIKLNVEPMPDDATAGHTARERRTR